MAGVFRLGQVDVRPQRRRNATRTQGIPLPALCAYMCVCVSQLSMLDGWMDGSDLDENVVNEEDQRTKRQRHDQQIHRQF
jgi:hypothetical protein